MKSRWPTHSMHTRILAGCLAVTASAAIGGCIPSNSSGDRETSVVETDDDATASSSDSSADESNDIVSDDSSDDVADDASLEVPPPSTEVRNNIKVTLADGYARPLETSCFYTEPFVIPPEWEFLDGSDADNCDFALQGPFADVAVVAGEMWSSSSGQTFDETVATVRSNLEAGAEPDIQILGRLNSGPSGIPLEIYSEEEIDSAQRAVLFTHSSQRRDGLLGYSAVVEVPGASDGSTLFILLWSVITADQEGLIQDLIEAMTTTVPAGLA